MFYEAMEAILPSLEVIIDSGDSGTQKIITIGSLIEMGGTDDNE